MAKPIITKATFDKSANAIHFGGVHMNHVMMDEIAHQTHIENLVDKFIARSESDLAFAQKEGAQLAPGGCGYQLKMPEGGYSERDKEHIQNFLDAVDGAVLSPLKKLIDSGKAPVNADTKH